MKALVPSGPDSVQDADWELINSGTQYNLWGLHHAPDGSIHACGDAGTVLQYVDQRWRTMPVVGHLAVHCPWDAGDGGLHAGGQMGQIFRYEKNAWHLVFDLYLDVIILAIWGSAPDSIYAVGDEGLILHWDGKQWQRMISGTKSALYNIWGFDDTHVLAVGDFGLVLRWNGENWTEFYAGTENFLFDIWGDALDNIFIVGLSGTLVHFDGKRWTLTPTRARDDLMAVDGLMRTSTLLAMPAISAAVATEAKAETTTEVKEDAAAVAEMKGDPAAGAGKIAVCAACHGENGGTPTAAIYPRLAGQSSEYLKSSLLAYRDGQRQGGMAAMMSPQVASLSDQDLSDIAAYYSQQEPFVKPKQSAPPAARARGPPQKP